jgi:hypothetical protein
MGFGETSGIGAQSLAKLGVGGETLQGVGEGGGVIRRNHKAGFSGSNEFG